LTDEIAQAFLDEVAEARSVLIGTHKNPDGDAVGCALALSQYFDQLKVDNEIVCHNPPAYNLEFLPGVRAMRQKPEREYHDLGIVVDLDSLDRLGDTEPYFAACRRLVVMDHHVPHEAPGDLRIVDTAAPATAVILSRLMFQLNVDVTQEMATCLLTGIITDTGCFRFPNTTPEAMHLAARLLESGGRIDQINEEVFARKPLSSVRLLGILLAKMELACKDRLAWSVLASLDFEMTGSSDEDTEGFVNEMLAIHTVEISALFREYIPGHTRVSLRSRGNVDVAEVARHFGGGGHQNAAGCSFDCGADEATEHLIPRLRQCLGSC
jgi:phosphoesterase RecJ-like protein